MLSDTRIRRMRLAGKPRKLFDAGGLYVLVTPEGGRYWRLKYRFGGREKLLALGVYPQVPLMLARARREEARKQIAAGVDPGAAKRAAKAAVVAREVGTFEAVAREWFSKFSAPWAASHAKTVERRLERDVFPWIGNRPVGEIAASELLAMLRRVEARGALETAHRIHQVVSQVLRYAVAIGSAQRDPSTDLRGALPSADEKHHAALTKPADVAGLMRAIADYRGSFVTRCALRLAALLFVRPGELRRAEWGEVDFENAVWRIPAAKMKARAEHLVPLSPQAITVLRELNPLTGGGRYLFPSVRGANRPMSENTVLAALRRMGYGTDEMSGHGFRSTASTLLNEMGWAPDFIERQLAHAERDEVRDAYNRAEYLTERRKMMRAWADYLDALASGGTVIPIRAVSA
jgi:integrase